MLNVQKNGGKMCLISGNEVIGIYSDVALTKYGYVVKDFEHHIGVVSFEGKKIIPCQYKAVSFAPNGIRTTTTEGLMGISLYDGKEIIPCIWNGIRINKEGYAVYKHGKWGAYLNDGTHAIDAEWDFVSISRNLVIVSKELLYGAFDGRGKQILPVCYKYILRKNDFLEVEDVHGKWGLYNLSGKCLIECKWASISSHANNVSICNFDNETADVPYEVVDRLGAGGVFF